MNLPEFLLARIAEDEAVAREALREEWADQWWPSEVYDDGVRNRAVAVSPRRVLADLEAKRQIVEARRAIAIPGDADCGPGQGHVWLDGAHRAVASERERILRLLALPYSDHPDYRDEWRPRHALPALVTRQGV